MRSCPVRPHYAGFFPLLNAQLYYEPTTCWSKIGSDRASPGQILPGLIQMREARPFAEATPRPPPPVSLALENFEAYPRVMPGSISMRPRDMPTVSPGRHRFRRDRQSLVEGSRSAVGAAAEEII